MQAETPPQALPFIIPALFFLPSSLSSFLSLPNSLVVFFLFFVCVLFFFVFLLPSLVPGVGTKERAF